MKGKAFTGMLLVNDAGGLREGEKGDWQQSRGEADAEEVDGTGSTALENARGHEGEEHAGVAERPDGFDATMAGERESHLLRPQRMRNESRRRRSSWVETTRKSETLWERRRECEPQILDAAPVDLQRRQAEERTHVHR